jgi:hypothetical protein
MNQGKALMNAVDGVYAVGPAHTSSLSYDLAKSPQNAVRYAADSMSSLSNANEDEVSLRLAFHSVPV